MLYKFVKRYAKRVASLSRSTFSAFSSFDSDCGAENEAFVPTLILCGSPRSGKAEVFNQYLLDTEYEQQSRKSNDSLSSSTGRKKSGFAPQKVSVESDLTAPLKSNHTSSSSLGFQNEEERSTETIAMWTDFKNGGNNEPVNQLAAGFEQVRGNLVNLPNDARFDETLLTELEGSICYLIPLDAFDLPATNGQSSSLLEQEVEQARRLALLDRKFDNGRLLLMFTRVNEFQEKIQSDRSKLPSWLTSNNENASPTELTSEVIGFLSQQITKSARVRATYVYPAADVPAAQNVLRIMVHSLYLSDNLRLAGFME